MEKRQELHDARRQRPWQHLTSLGVLFGLIFTAGGLVYTAKTWETGQETLRTTQQQQITDRYTKAVEQIGSDKSVEVRIGGLYALERIAKDSLPDAETIRNVVVAFILEHDRPVKPEEGARWKPEADLGTALRILDTLVGISGVTDFLLTGAYFDAADWTYEDLTGAHLRGANLTGADLTGANLVDADLFYARLTGANLTYARLTGANLVGADLVGADLRDVDLTGAHLTGADLRDVKGVTPEQIRKVARTDDTTKF